MKQKATTPRKAVDLALQALRSCVTGNYKDPERVMRKSYRFDSKLVAAAIAALEPASEAPTPVEEHKDDGWRFRRMAEAWASKEIVFRDVHRAVLQGKKKPTLEQARLAVDLAHQASVFGYTGGAQ